ncbi:MAG TPA: lysylphosphatidylglycerol synthase transmembrane domain-containing protein [Saprospiraceae bacterium]|nr:lysylphosphatidylglycerol synthase transmembrane domain-containing protein [Saprospiraceae bacterium]
MNSKLISIIKYIIVLAISFGLLALAFKGIAVKAILEGMLQINIPWLIVAILVGILGFISRAYRWRLLIESLGYTPSLKNTTYSLMVGYFANLALPRLGEVTRCGSLSKAESIPFTSLLGTVIIERVVDVLTLLLCLLLAAIVEFDRVGNFLRDTIFHPLAAKFQMLFSSTFIIIGGLIFLVILVMLIIYFIRRLNSKKEESKVMRLVRGLVNGLQSIAKLKRPWIFIFHSLFVWFLSFLGMYVSFFLLPSTSGLGWSAALVLLVVSGFGMAAPVQGGIGAFHLLVSQGLILYGLSQQDGLTFATLVHGLSLLLVVGCGIASLLLLFSAKNKKLAQQEVIDNT